MTDAQGLFMVASILAGWVFAQFQIVALLQRKGRSKAFGHFVGACVSWLGAFAGLLISGGLMGVGDTASIATRVTLPLIGLAVLAPFVYFGRAAKRQATAGVVPAPAVEPKPFAALAHIASAAVMLRTKLRQHADAARQAMRSRPPPEREKTAMAKTDQPAGAAPLLPADFVFDYIDRDGVITSRSVLACRIEASDSNHYLTGFCEERRSERSFRFDRISGRLRVKDTGRFVSSHELLAANPAPSQVVFDRSYFRKG
ncbi:WYL domain-containing protein [Acidovorax sp. NPDC077693]|uniref:WYL domain-containing protein n=1 Tax=unclassified Acidovorax TaxID=2684926 RepID=UPI0037CA78FE